MKNRVMNYETAAIDGMQFNVCWREPGVSGTLSPVPPDGDYDMRIQAGVCYAIRVKTGQFKVVT